MNHSTRTNPFINRKPLTGGGREPFLARVRKGLGHPEHQSPPPGDAPALDQSLIRQVPSNDPGRVDRFAAKMKENKGEVHRVPNDAATILAAIDTCLAKHPIKRALLNLQQLGHQFPVAAHLQSKQIETLEWGTPDAFAGSYSCDAAITDAPAGLADTGALLVWSDPHFGRSSTLVTPVHITLLPASRILADMIDGFDLVLTRENGHIPSNVVVINGPSKTGDIEMKLVTGVHGPKFIYVILIDGI